MKLHAMGISHRHDKDFFISRPDGSGDDLLIIFKTDAYIITDGARQDVSAGSAVIFSKGTPQYYGARGGEYENHWVHFEAEETDIFFDRIGVRFNVPCPAADIIAAESILNMLSLESISDKKSAESEDLLLRLLIVKTAGGGHREISPHGDVLRRLRAEIYSTPSGKYTIDSLARRVSLSPSHFQVLYRQQFGVSCYEDVISARMAAAEHYLKNTQMSVKEIAGLCGYENDVHFIRQFGSRKGLTPTQFRSRP